jgi:uncharacterized damage-inducible protein DinB
MTTDPEISTLLDYLGSTRRHLLAQLDGLTDEQLTQPVLPSQWTLLGLVHHLALDVEEFWFRHVLAGEPFTPLDGEAWDVPDGMPVREVFALYDDACRRSEEIARGLAPMTLAAWWPDFLGPEVDTVRDVLLHVIIETTTHAGQVDVVRELIDGKQWIVLTE